ncbi:MAG: hypothetical protein J0I41_16510 [Filimonas sp.]|nr:hypothetical protein [Filimonas sp.]
MRTFYIFLFVFSSSLLHAQTKKLEFYGYRLMQYQRPILALDGIYKAYYQNMGETFSNGRFELDESNRTFLLKWENGNDWSARYTKKTTTTNGYDSELGAVTEVCYAGTWVDDYSTCELRVLQTKDKGCVIELRSGKAIDADKGINAWKKVFRFYVRGCFENAQPSLMRDTLQKEDKSKLPLPKLNDVYLPKAFINNPKSVAWKISEYRENPNGVETQFKSIKSNMYLIFYNSKIYLLEKGNIVGIWQISKRYLEDEISVMKTKEGYIFSQLGNITITYPNNYTIEYDGYDVPIKGVFIDKKFIR